METANHEEFDGMSREELINQIIEFDQVTQVLMNNYSAAMMFLQIDNSLNSFLAWKNIYSDRLDELRNNHRVSKQRDKIMTVILTQKERYNIKEFIPNPN